LAKESSDREKHLQRRNGEFDREIDRLITNIAKGADFDIYNPKVNEPAAERKCVKAELAQIAAASEIVTVHPATIERYVACRLASWHETPRLFSPLGILA